MTAALPPVTLILGGMRSGKSRHAEHLAEAQPGPCLYLATAQARDDEMAARIARHQARRGARWRTLEEPLELAAVLAATADTVGVVLVDCLTLWLANLMAAERDPACETDRLTESLDALRVPVVFVSNEVGLGVVPDNALARRFIDHAGRLHRRLAERAQSVVFMVAGQALTVKS